MQSSSPWTLLVTKESLNTVDSSHEIVHLKELHFLFNFVVLMFLQLVITVFRVSEARGWRFLNKSRQPFPRFLNSHKVWNQLLLDGRPLYQGLGGRGHLVDKLQLCKDGHAMGGEACANDTH